MIFQEPLSALSPLQKIGRQMEEVVRIHEDVSAREARRIAQTWLEKVKIPDAAERLHAYPYQLSGGMQQRIMIAMALMLSPELIIADEPTTALDVTIQAQVFQLIREMKQERASILLITHDMGVVWDMCDRVAVMYASRIVETGSVADIFNGRPIPTPGGCCIPYPAWGMAAGSGSLRLGAMCRPRWTILRDVISGIAAPMRSSVVQQRSRSLWMYRMVIWQPASLRESWREKKLWVTSRLVEVAVINMRIPADLTQSLRVRGSKGSRGQVIC